MIYLPQRHADGIGKYLVYKSDDKTRMGFPLGYRGKWRDFAYFWKTQKSCFDYVRRRMKFAKWERAIKYEVWYKQTINTFVFVKVFYAK